MYFKDRHLYSYPSDELAITNDQIIDNFFSEEKFKQYDMTDNMEQWVIEQEKANYEKRMKGKERELTWLDYVSDPFPLSLKISYDQAFRSTISQIFYSLGLDHYSKFAKINLFNLLVFIPGLLLGVIAISNYLIKVLDGDYDEEESNKPVQ